MTFAEKLSLIRKSKGITQEHLAELLDISRQAVARWESGQSYPDIANLIQISTIFNITIDYLVKDQDCSVSIENALKNGSGDMLSMQKLISFRIEAAQNTYAGYGPEEASSRPMAHELKYQKGSYLYIDSYLGGPQFAGEEVVYESCRNQSENDSSDNIWKPVWSMNYTGHVLTEHFSGDFLKDALRHADMEHPYRGLDVYQSGEYTYKSSAAGNPSWFQGYEEIYFHNEKCYECYFHGTAVK